MFVQRDGIFIALLFIAIAVAAAAGAYSLGQDINYDLRNYHLYSAYALLENRFGRDHALADIYTYMNPTFYVVPYLIIKAFKPLTAGMTMAVLQSTNIMLAFAMAWYLIQGIGRAERWLLAIAAAAIAATGAMFVAELGSSFSDIWTSVLLVSAAWLLMSTRPRDLVRPAAAGILVGVATGLKLTNGFFAIAAAACLLVGWRSLREWLQASSLLVIGAVLGFAASAGYWSFYLWSTYGNPVFPFYNLVFASPDYHANNIKDERFVVTSFGQLLSGPIDALSGAIKTAEFAFRDGRYAVILVLVAAVLFAGRTLALSTAVRRLLLFCLAAYIVWYPVFSVQRYLLPVEILAGPLCVALACALLPPGRAVALSAAVVVFLAAWNRTGDWGRTAWGNEGMQSPVPESFAPVKVFVFLDAPRLPVSYAALSLPPTATFVRLGGHVPVPPGGQADRKLRGIFDAARGGPMRSMLMGPEIPTAAQVLLDRYGLRVTEDCLPVVIARSPFKSCVIDHFAR